MVQLIPREDNFDKGSPAYNDKVAAYIGLVPSAAGYGLAYLADFDQDEQPSAAMDDVVASPNYAAFMERRYSDEDVRVQLSSTLAVDQQPAGNSSVYYSRSGVLCRIQGGSVSGSDTTSVQLTGFDAYGFEVTGTGATLRFALVRYDAGARTELLGLDVPLTFNFNLAAPLILRLDVQTVGGNPTLSAFLTNVEVLGILVQDFPLFAGIPDVSANKITGPGRTGFVIGTDREFSAFNGEQSRTKVQYFQANPLTGLDPASGVSGGFRDRFARTELGRSIQITNQFGATGRSVQSAFVGDQFTDGGTEPLDYFATARPLVVGNGTSSTRFYSFISNRFPDDPHSQTPELQFQLNLGGSTGSSYAIGGGVSARATSPLGGATMTGYVALLQYVDTPSTTAAWDIRVYRYVNGTRTLLASGPGTVGSEGPATKMTLRLEVAPANGVGQESGPVQIRVLAGPTALSKVEQTLTSAGAPSVVPVGAYLVDQSVDRITQGFEGMVFESQNTTHGVIYETWTQGTLVNGGDVSTEIPSVSFTAEPSATASINDFADLAIPYSTTDRLPAQADRMESGHAWTRALELSGRRYWAGVRTGYMTETERDAFLGFWREHGVPGAAFNLTDDILGATFKVRAVRASLEEERSFKDVHAFTFDLEEVR